MKLHALVGLMALVLGGIALFLGWLFLAGAFACIALLMFWRASSGAPEIPERKTRFVKRCHELPNWEALWENEAEQKQRLRQRIAEEIPGKR